MRATQPWSPKAPRSLSRGAGTQGASRRLVERRDSNLGCGEREAALNLSSWGQPRITGRAAAERPCGHLSRNLIMYEAWMEAVRWNGRRGRSTLVGRCLSLSWGV